MSMFNKNIIWLSFAVTLVSAEQPMPTASEIYEKAPELKKVPDMKCFLGLMRCKQCTCTMEGMTGPVPQKACWLAEHLKRAGEGESLNSEERGFVVEGPSGVGKTRMIEAMVANAGGNVIAREKNSGMWLRERDPSSIRVVAKQLREEMEKKNARHGVVILDCAEFLFAMPEHIARHPNDEKLYKEYGEQWVKAMEDPSITWILVNTDPESCSRESRDKFKDQTITLGLPGPDCRGALIDEFTLEFNISLTDGTRSRLIGDSKGYTVSQMHNFFNTVRIEAISNLHEGHLRKMMKACSYK